MLVDNHYQYDGNGNRIGKKQLQGAIRYAYDALNRLKRVEYPDYTEELFYDRAGNRRKRVAGEETEVYHYDRRNRLTERRGKGGREYYTYDEAGNLLRDGRAAYTYDAFHRTSKVETFSGEIQINRYDAEGLRYEMEENGKLVQFIYRDREIVFEEKAEEKVRYIRTDKLLASDAQQARTWYHYASDELGSITQVEREGEIVNRYEYDAWGNLIACEERVENRFQFNGQQLDPISQQYYLRARYYNPVIGRFTQEDTYDEDGLNLYAYCRNNPVCYVDPSGNICEKKAQEIMGKIDSRQANRNECKNLSSYLREKMSRGETLSNQERNVAQKLGVDVESGTASSKGGSGGRLIPGTEGIVTGGDSTKLGKNMMESMGLPRGTNWTGHQAQHIIPAEMANHPVLQRIGMDLDDASNGLFLRTPADDINAMSRHRGYHSTYNEFVRTQLDGMDINQSVDVLQKQVYDLQQNLKYLQRSGLLYIQVKVQL